MLITGTIFTKLKVHKFTSEDISMMLGLEQSMTKCLDFYCWWCLHWWDRNLPVFPPI